MNKQEALKKIEAQKETIIELTGWAVFRYIETLIEQLDEPEKVKIPQFVADWYEENKEDLEFNIWDWIAFRNEPEKLKNKEFNYWINDGEGNPIQTLVNMHQFGYTVEKEKRYTVVMKETKQPLYYNAGDKKLFFSMAKIASHFTKQQLEKLNFSWVFDCERIEVEEVEE